MGLDGGESRSAVHPEFSQGGADMKMFCPSSRCGDEKTVRIKEGDASLVDAAMPTEAGSAMDYELRTYEKSVQSQHVRVMS